MLRSMWLSVLRHRALVVYLVASLVLPMALQSQVVRADYDCFMPHCYGISNWKGGMFGALGVVAITGGTTSNFTGPDGILYAGQFSDEMWVGNIADTRPGCVKYGDYCWVEAGYVNRAGGASHCPNPVLYGCYFYAYVDPTLSKNQFTEIDYDFVQASDVGQLLGLIILHDSNNFFYVELATPHATYNLPPFYVAVDTYNHFLGASSPIIQIGREVFGEGSGGKTAVSTAASGFAYSSWYDANLTAYYQSVPEPYYGGNWYPASTGPVNAFWWPGQEPSQYGTGGRWFAAACC